MNRRSPIIYAKKLVLFRKRFKNFMRKVANFPNFIDKKSFVWYNQNKNTEKIIFW